MNKKEIKHLDLNLYEETLPNGLQVYVIPKNNVNNVYVTFSTKYGSANNEFIPLGEKDMIEVPKGVAHFLEHKLFAQPNGEDPLSFFTMHGASGNANTGNFKTTYLFSGPDMVNDNLNYLLDYVQQPYFTDENVEKEKGIILQEINMRKDDPYTEAFESLLLNCFQVLPIRYNVLGSKESINSITKEDLYRCYNTFYHPSNMFVAVTGNVNAEEIINVIKENQAQKEWPKPEKVVVKEYEEPREVGKKDLVLHKNVAIPKILLAFKLKLSDVPLRQKLVRFYLSIYSQMKFGNISQFLAEIKEEQIVTDGIGVSLIADRDDAILIYDAETYQPDVLKERILQEVNLEGLNEEDFERKKKAFLASTIYMSDNIFRLNEKIMGEIIDEDFVDVDIYEEIQNMNWEEFLKVIKTLKFDQVSTVTIMPTEK